MKFIIEFQVDARIVARAGLIQFVEVRKIRFVAPANVGADRAMARNDSLGSTRHVRQHHQPGAIRLEIVVGPVRHG